MDRVTSPNETKIEAGGGLRIFYRWWLPWGPAKAALVIVPGFNSHSGYFDWFGKALAAAGIATYALDLHGRGRSDGERYYVDQFADYVGDVDVVMKAVRAGHPGLPTYIMGHSAGGVVAWLYTLDHGAQVAGLISESFAFELPAPDFALAVLKGLSHIAPHAQVLALKNADFSRDPAAVAAMDGDPLIAHETQPTKTLAAIVRADARLKAEFNQVTVPVLIVHGTSDHAAKPAGSQFAFDHVGSSDKTLKLYEGAYHDLLNDVGREQVLADMQAWLLSHLA